MRALLSLIRSDGTEARYGRLRLKAGSGIALDEAGETVTVRATGSGPGGGAPADAQYVVASVHADLTAERALTGVTGQTNVDTGTAGQIKVGLTPHLAAADPHAQYALDSEKGTANGYAGLDSGGKVPQTQLGTGSGGAGAKFLADDQTFKTPSASVAISSAVLDFTDGDTFKRFTIADAAVSASSKIVGIITRPSTTDANDPGWTYLPTVVSRGTGTFDLLVAVFDWNAPAESGLSETVTFNYTLA